MSVSGIKRKRALSSTEQNPDETPASLLEKLFAVYPTRTITSYHVICEWTIDGKASRFKEDTHEILAKSSTIEEAIFFVCEIVTKDMSEYQDGLSKRIRGSDGWPEIHAIKPNFFASSDQNEEIVSAIDCVLISVKKVQTTTRQKPRTDYLCFIKRGNKRDRGFKRLALLGPFLKMDEANTKAALEWDKAYRRCCNVSWHTTSFSAGYNKDGCFNGNVILGRGNMEEFTVVKRDH